VRFYFKFFIVFIISTSIFGSTKSKEKINPPKWTTIKKELLKVDGKYYFRGLGVSKDLYDPKMTLSNSKDKARVQISFLLKEYLSFIKKERIELDMPISDCIKLVKNKLKVVKTWVHPETKAVYTLLEMDVDLVKVKLSTSFIDNAKWKFKRVTPVVFPDWAMESNKIIKKDGKYYFHALGLSSDLGDKSMTYSASADNARVNLAFFIKSTLKSTITKSSNGDTTVSTQQTTKMKYSGAKIIKSWVHPKNNTVYTLLEVSVDAINKSNNNIISSEFIKNLQK